MKYKLLLMGKNMVAIDDFFNMTEGDFELQSCSTRLSDIRSHLKYFQPDAAVYCMHYEDNSAIKNMNTIVKMAQKEELPFIVVGTEDDIEEFENMVSDHGALILKKPTTAGIIREKVVEHLDSLREQEEEKRREQERIEEEKRLEQERQEEERRKSEKKRVLVVDDDVQMVRSIKRFLEEKYAVASAVNGKIALRYLDSKPVDVILLDYEMPEMSGPEVLEKIRENEEHAKIPVVFLTGASEKEKITKALIMKPQGYILKPVEREALEEKIKSILGE